MDDEYQLSNGGCTSEKRVLKELGLAYVALGKWNSEHWDRDLGTGKKILNGNGINILKAF